MKIVIAPDSYKESLSSLQVAAEIEAGFREIFPDAEYLKLPMADGGEGTVDALVAATGGTIREVSVTGPLGIETSARYGVTADGTTAVIEMAAASGLALVPPLMRNPLKTTSYGTGELIKAALEGGVTHLIVGIGGSATNDAGAGMLQALGARLLNGADDQIGFGGATLADLDRIDLSCLDERLRSFRLEVACDVGNTLTGPAGASAVYGPQKGATPEMVAQLDANLRRFAEVIRSTFGKEVDAVPGAGAAGGIGAAFLLLNATLRPGVDIVMDAVGLEEAVRDADLVITGEGRIDSQTINGKTPIGVARVAKQFGKPVLAIAGSASADAAVVHTRGIDAVFTVLSEVGPLEEALEHATANLRTTARNVAAALKIGKLWQCP